MTTVTKNLPCLSDGPVSMAMVTTNLACQMGFKERSTVVVIIRPTSCHAASESSLRKRTLQTCETAFCHSNAECIELVGDGIKCMCKDGYGGDGVTVCTDLDECVLDSPCEEDAKGGYCVDNDPPQKYTCGCRKGYIVNATMFDSKHGPLGCYDYDECSAGEHDCDVDHGVCTNNPGSYSCQCESGYEGDGKTCTKIQVDNRSPVGPCDPDPCNPHNQDCHVDDSKLAGYLCICHKGYFHPSGHGGACENWNECINNAHDCDKNAYCTDTIGSYKCTCNEGWIGDGRTCIDENECSASLSPPACSGDLICINRPGSYECVQPTPAPTPAPTPRPTAAPPPPPPPFVRQQTASIRVEQLDGALSFGVQLLFPKTGGGTYDSGIIYDDADCGVGPTDQYVVEWDRGVVPGEGDAYWYVVDIDITSALSNGDWDGTSPAEIKIFVHNHEAESDFDPITTKAFVHDNLHPDEGYLIGEISDHCPLEGGDCADVADGEVGSLMIAYNLGTPLFKPVTGKLISLCVPN